MTTCPMLHALSFKHLHIEERVIIIIT